MNGYAAFHRKLPFVGFSDTKPLCVAKTSCRTPSIDVRTGVECVMASFCERQARLPSVVRKAINDEGPALALRKIKPFSVSGEAAFCQPITSPPYVMRRSLDQMTEPLVAFNRSSLR